MIENIVICILIILIIYNLFYKKSPETFINIDLNSYLKNKITENYNNKKIYIDNILKFLKQMNDSNNNLILTKYNNGKTLDCKKIKTKTLHKLKSQNFKNLTINGNLLIKGGIEIDKTATVNIVPRYMIVAWYDKVYKDQVLSIPQGWALCDGNSYTLDENYNAIKVNPDLARTAYVTTPDLRNRFVIGALDDISIWTDFDNKKKTSTAKPFGTKGGSNEYTLTQKDIPTHYHFYTNNRPSKMPDSVRELQRKNNLQLVQTGVWSNSNVIPKTAKIDVEVEDAGSVKPDPINILPKCISLFYIMKL